LKFSNALDDLLVKNVDLIQASKEGQLWLHGYLYI
jgi:hypothetical protein